MIKHFFTKQFLLFIVMGGAAAFINWISRIIFSNWMSFYLAVFYAYGLGMTVAFTLNSMFVFSRSKKPKRKQARDFMIVNLISFPIVLLSSITIEHLLLEYGFINYRQAIAHGLALIVPILGVFLIYKYFAFNEKYRI